MGFCSRIACEDGTPEFQWCSLTAFLEHLEFYENLNGWAESTSPTDKPDRKEPMKQKFDFAEELSTEERIEMEKKMLMKLPDAMKGKKREE